MSILEKNKGALGKLMRQAGYEGRTKRIKKEDRDSYSGEKKRRANTRESDHFLSEQDKEKSNMMKTLTEERYKKLDTSERKKYKNLEDFRKESYIEKSNEQHERRKKVKKQKNNYEDGGIINAQAKYAAIQGLRDEMSDLGGESLFSKNYENGGVVSKSQDIESKLELAEKLLNTESSKEEESDDLDNLSREELIARLRKAE